MQIEITPTQSASDGPQAVTRVGAKVDVGERATRFDGHEWRPNRPDRPARRIMMRAVCSR